MVVKNICIPMVGFVSTFMKAELVGDGGSSIPETIIRKGNIFWYLS